MMIQSSVDMYYFSSEHSDWQPDRKLAYRVIIQALCDLISPNFVNEHQGGKAETIRSARIFFESDDENITTFKLMCDLAFSESSEYMQKRLRKEAKGIISSGIGVNYELKRSVLPRGRSNSSRRARSRLYSCQAHV